MYLHIAHVPVNWVLIETQRCVQAQVFCVSTSRTTMGVGRIFSTGWPLVDFLKDFLGGAESAEICFFALDTKKTTFFAEIFKIQGGQGPPVPRSDAHGTSFTVQ